MGGFPDWQQITEWLGAMEAEEQDRTIGLTTLTLGPYTLSSWASVIVAVKPTVGTVRLRVTQGPGDGPATLRQTQQWDVTTGNVLIQAIPLLGDEVTVEFVGQLAGTKIDYAIYPANTVTQSVSLGELVANIYRNGIIMAQRPGFNFISEPYITWDIADDAANDRANIGAILGAHAVTHKHGGTDEVATATPAANAIPKATAGAVLDGWISDATTAVKGKVQLATSGEVSASKAVAANDSRLSDARPPTGAAGGDLTGTFPSPTIASYTGTGPFVRQASPTLTGTVTAGTVSATAYQVAGVALAASDLSNGVTGSGAVVLAASPTITGTLTAATISASGNITAAGNVGGGGASGAAALHGKNTASGEILRLEYDGSGNYWRLGAKSGAADFELRQATTLGLTVASGTFDVTLVGKLNAPSKIQFFSGATNYANLAGTTDIIDLLRGASSSLYGDLRLRSMQIDAGADAGAGLYFSNVADVKIRRTAANTLTIDDGAGGNAVVLGLGGTKGGGGLKAQGGIVTATTSGATPTDGTVYYPVDGAIVVGTDGVGTTKLWARVGGAWKAVALV